MEGWQAIFDNWQASIDVWHHTNFFAFIVFFIPGFIILKVYDFKVPNVRRDFSKAIFEVIAYSGMNFIFFSPLLSLINDPNFQQVHKYIFILSIYLIFLIMPLMWPDIYLKILSLKFVARRLPNPYDNPWDYLFYQGLDRSYVIVHFKSGERVGGIFGPKSFASTSIAKEQLYLEEVWELDENDGFINPLDRSKGIIIFRDEIVSVEFFE